MSPSYSHSAIASGDGLRMGRIPGNARKGTHMETISLSTEAFESGERIPERFTCTGKNISPALAWSDPPAGTKRYLLICEDPDAPSGTFTHWILFNIPSERRGLPEDSGKSPVLDDGSMHGVNSYGKLEYAGPCPPPGSPHRYFFRLYALDAQPNLRSPADRRKVEEAMKGHVLAQGECMGIFSR